LLSRDTIEDRILQLQEKKKEMVASAFGQDSTGQIQRPKMTMDDLLFLFKG
jgi:SNF2 family DNA or RNA helicase